MEIYLSSAGVSTGADRRKAFKGELISSDRNADGAKVHARLPGAGWTNSLTTERVEGGAAHAARPLILSMAGALLQPVHSSRTLHRTSIPTMQLTNFPTATQFPAVIAAMHGDRIERYLPAAGGLQEDALRLYLWNCTLCESFYLPLHIAEVACRNAIHQRLCDRLGRTWYEHPIFLRTLDARRTDELNAALYEERKQHNSSMTEHHLCSSLMFAFWGHLLTKRFDRLLWSDGVQVAFPNLPRAMGREQVHERFNELRQWRNRIAHHRAIFDRKPTAKAQHTFQLVRWVSHDLADWLTSASKVSQAINLRPRITA